MQPFPENYFNVDYLQQYIGPRKDIDGITDCSILSVLKYSNPNFAPCTAEACIRILKHYKIPLDGAHVVVVGRSMVVGKPVAILLDKENATVTLCNSHTKNLQEITKSADIVIAALGKKNFLTKDYFSPNQTVIDVGFHCDEDGISGDVDKEVADYVKNITPVPGGVGSVTTAVLINHLYKAANKRLVKSVEE
jgi:methylenetetrahydrofolate dehydrogenase (NADP+) / methenyltetrahydrofolate cyclohydrolase